MNNYIDEKYELFMELLLELTLFGIEGFIMSEIVKMSKLLENQSKKLIKNIL